MNGEFVEYVMAFYGKGGIYEMRDEAGDPLTAEAVRRLLPYMASAMTEQGWNWGDGDSMDREFFREEVLEHAGYTEHITQGESK